MLANVIGKKVIKRFTHFEIVNLFGQIPSPYSFLCIGLVRIMVGSLRYVKIDVSPPIFFHVIYVGQCHRRQSY